MRSVLVVGSAALIVAGCALAPSSSTPAAPTAAQIEAETQRIDAWFEARYEEQLQFSPIQMTFLGRKDLYDQLDDLSIAAEDEQLAWQKASVEQMEAQFDYALLSGAVLPFAIHGLVDQAAETR